MKIAVVFSGGGAKGAYQAGIVRALAELGIEVVAVSGASIGSLNAAILASSKDIAEAANKLDRLWHQVAVVSPIQFNPQSVPRYLSLAGAIFARGAAPWLALLLGGLEAVLKATGKTGTGEANDSDGLFTNSALSNIINSSLDFSALSSGPQMYVSVYRHTHGASSLFDFVRGDVLDFDNRESEFIKINKLPLADQKSALLASTALPALFSAQSIDGIRYSDGGQGGYNKVQGNTPITPLLGQGYDLILVSHLSDGSLWDRRDFPLENVLEIRPSETIAKDGFKDMLGFNEEKILRWMEQGRVDALRILSDTLDLADKRAGMLQEGKGLVEIADPSLSDGGLQVTLERLRVSNKWKL